MSKVSLAPYECVCLCYLYRQLGIDAELLVLMLLATNLQVLPKYEGNLCYTKCMFSMALCCTANQDTILKHLSWEVIVCGDLSCPEQAEAVA